MIEVFRGYSWSTLGGGLLLPGFHKGAEPQKMRSHLPRGCAELRVFPSDAVA